MRIMPSFWRSLLRSEIFVTRGGGGKKTINYSQQMESVTSPVAEDFKP